MKVMLLLQMVCKALIQKGPQVLRELTGCLGKHLRIAFLSKQHTLELLISNSAPYTRFPS